jgi:DNA-binding NarL/FixJ family response regulator
MSIRILLADDHALIIEGLRALLGQHPDMEVIAVVPDGREAIRVACAERPDVVIMDVAMPGMNGIEATRQLSTELPEIKVLCLSMHADRQLVLAMLDAGAAGYVLKQRTETELIQAIRTVVGNQTYLCPSIAGFVVDAYKAAQAFGPTSALSLLTAREREVLQLIAEGHSNKEMAARLGVSAKTINTHREHLMAKLDLHSVAELTKCAIREGLTSFDS